MQDLYKTDPTQETRPRSCRLCGYIAPTRQRERDHTDQGTLCPAEIFIVDHKVGIDDPSELSFVGWGIELLT